MVYDTYKGEKSNPDVWYFSIIYEDGDRECVDWLDLKDILIHEGLDFLDDNNN